MILFIILRSTRGGRIGGKEERAFVLDYGNVDGSRRARSVYFGHGCGCGCVSWRSREKIELRNQWTRVEVGTCSPPGVGVARGSFFPVLEGQNGLS